MNLFLFRGAVTQAADSVELFATQGAIVVPTRHGRVRLDLLAFGPTSQRRHQEPHAGYHGDVPLFGSHLRVPEGDAVEQIDAIPTWENRLQQEIWGKALVRAGRKHRDPKMVRQGLAHLRAARKP